MRVGFAYNPTSEAALRLRDRAVEWCTANELDHWTSEAGARDALIDRLDGTDMVVVLGGDGTFLRAARAAATVDVPILGVNSGKIGFLSKVEAENLEAVLGNLAAGDGHDTESRMVLEARIVRGGDAAHDASAGDVHVALNEAAVVRGAQARVVRLEVLIDGSHVATYIADGLVVATPTGSTAYSFSAGGPILDPTARNLVVTPIAAYLSAIRSVVVSPRHQVRVRVLEAHDCLVSIDGYDDMPLSPGDEVVVVARDRPLRFVEPAGALAFWDLLRRKVELLPS